MAVDFVPASSQYIDFGSAASIDDIWSGGGAIALWLKMDIDPADNGYYRVAGQANAGATAGWIFQMFNATGATAWDRSVRFYAKFSGGIGFGEWAIDESLTPANGTWFHVVVVYNSDADTNDPIVYIDGVDRSASMTERATPVGSFVSGAALNVQIGNVGLAAGEYFDGQIGQLRLFTRTLSPEEVAILAAGYDGPLGGEVLWISGGDFRGIAHPDGATLAGANLLADLSGNNNDGTPINSPVARASEAPRYFPWWGFLYASGTTFAQAVGGAFSPTGTLSKAVLLALSGSVSFAGSLARLLKRLWAAVGLVFWGHPATGDVEIDISPNGTVRWEAAIGDVEMFHLAEEEEA